MRLLVQSTRRFFYRHPGQLLLALIGIAAGVAVITGVALMRDVLINALDLAGEELAGRDSIRIEHPTGRLDEGLLGELAIRPGAPMLVPVISTRVRVDGRILELLATDPMSLDGTGGIGLGGNRINALMRTRAGVALNIATAERLGLTEGDRFEVRVAGAHHDLEVAVILERGRALDDRLLMDIAMAQDLLGRQGELSWIEAPAGSRRWLESELPENYRLLEAGERRDAAARLTEGMRANLSAMSLLSLAVGLFVIYSVLSFLLVQRRQAFGMLRAVGVTRAQITGLLALETFLLAGLGALLGLVLGTVMADQLLDLVRQPVAELYRLVPAAETRPTAALYLLTWTTAVVLALASTLTVWNEARRIPPGQLVRQDSQTPDRKILYLAAGALLMAGLGAIVLSSALAAALVGLFLALMGCALLAPTAGMRVLHVMRLPARGRLFGRAVAMLASGRRRIGPALAALSLALALSAGIGMMVLGFRVTVDDWVDRLLRADAYVTLSQGEIDQSLTERVSQLDGLAALSSARQRPLPDGRVLIAYDLPADAWEGFELVAGHSEPARTAFMAGEAVLVTEPYARRHDVAVGEPVSLDTPGGRRMLPVAAIYRDYGSDQGAIAIDAGHYREWFGDEARDSLGLYFDRSPVQPDRWHERLQAIDERIVLTTREQVRNQTMAVFDRTFRISWALAVLVGGIALIALISALLALGMERRRDYATLRALGMSRGSLAALVVSQTTALAAASAAVAVPLAVAIHAGLTLVIQPRAFGWSLPLTLPLSPLVAMLVLALITGLVAGLYPAWHIATRDPAPQLRSH